METFKDLLEANQGFAASFQSQELSGAAKKGLAIVTCMDSRIDPLRIVGMDAGDAKILRNAGARVTDDVLRTLVLATHLLNVDRILVMPHTDCRMASATEEEVHALILEKCAQYVISNTCTSVTEDLRIACIHTDNTEWIDT